MRGSVVPALFALAAAAALAGASARLDPLHFHVARANVDRVAAMLQLPDTDVNVRDDESGGQTALHVAVSAEGLDMTGLLGEDALRHALSLRGQLVAMLLEHHADPNLADDAGRAPLHVAAASPLVLPLLEQLLAESAASVRLDAVDRDGRTPLFVAVVEQNDGAVLALLKRGPEATRISDAHGATVLHAAVASGAAATVQALINAGADVNARDAEGETPLHRCVRANQTEICARLLAQGALKSAQNKALQTPLHLAVELHAAPEIVQLLVAQTSTTTNSIPDSHGRSPFFLAALSGNLDALKSLPLLDSLKLKDERGWTPLHAAASRGHVAAVEFLLRAYTDATSTVSLRILQTVSIDTHDNRGNSPLHLALYHGHVDAARCLVFAGAKIDDKARFLQATLGEQERHDAITLLRSTMVTLARLVNWMPALAIISLLVYGAVVYFMFTFVRLAKSAAHASGRAAVPVNGLDSN